ncbi:MAG TPA: hypothetical protein VF974_01250 [Patescibacteria group bacterium]
MAESRKINNILYSEKGGFMATTTLHNGENAKKPLTGRSKKKPGINPHMKDFSNDPYFVKKAEDAKRLLDKYGVPKNK